MGGSGRVGGRRGGICERAERAASPPEVRRLDGRRRPARAQFIAKKEKEKEKKERGTKQALLRVAPSPTKAYGSGAGRRQPRAVAADAGCMYRRDPQEWAYFSSPSLP